MYNIENEFLKKVKELATTIVKELNVSDQRRTIQKTNRKKEERRNPRRNIPLVLFSTIVPGLAGGDKYLFDGLFVKLAKDVHKIYGGDEFSLKAVDHSVKSLLHLSQSKIKSLRLPTIVAVDYLGNRLEVQVKERKKESE
jgi:hypothetical protein